MSTAEFELGLIRFVDDSSIHSVKTQFVFFVLPKPDLPGAPLRAHCRLVRSHKGVPDAVAIQVVKKPGHSIELSQSSRQDVLLRGCTKMFQTGPRTASSVSQLRRRFPVWCCKSAIFLAVPPTCSTGGNMTMPYCCTAGITTQTVLGITIPSPWIVDGRAIDPHSDLLAEHVFRRAFQNSMMAMTKMMSIPTDPLLWVGKNKLLGFWHLVTTNTMVRAQQGL